MAEVHPHPVAIVTGAGRGIGRAIALALAREGYTLCIAARTREELEETRRLSGMPIERALIILVDFAEEESAEAVVETTLDLFGRIDVLVNNAGWAPPRTMLTKMRAIDAARILAVNLNAPIAMARLAATSMVERGSGVIINIASSAARLRSAGEAVYAAAKAGLVAFTHAAFAELGDRGIKVSVIVPGLVDTALIPQNKRLDRELMLSPDDIADAVLSIIRTPARVCPVELVIHPQRRPERSK
ncbi:MAG TPA: SDR family oxidoreductase [Candidatus Binataceae bacterium]|nr:SDR family oxidoreductase [Candidatus Binataceae bacterium]